VAASYCSTTLAGMRPRSLTAIPWPVAQARMLPLRSRLAAVRPGRRRCPLPGVLLAQIDLIVRAVDPEPHRLIGRAAVKIVFERDGYLLCHLGLPDRVRYQHRTRSTAMG